jgi:hypothetical protein
MKGSIMVTILIFGLIFLILLSGLFMFVLIQMKVSLNRLAWNQSLHIAEAGVNYYRWCLNNDGDCNLEGDYFDAEGNLVGHYSLEVIPTVSCGETIEKKIYSTGWTNEFPDAKRKIGVLYARASVAKYAYLLNDNVWAGLDRVIRGLYHSNGGVRMDGENQSLVTSSLPEWVCTSSFGCSSCPVINGCRIESFQCICPGVFTTEENSNSGLFNYPVSSFDFDGITIDLAQIKSNAQASSLYLPPSKTINSNADGYHLKFQSNGSVEVWIITRLWSDWAYDEEQDWHYDYFRIRDEYLYNTYYVNSGCPVIFAEDNIWVEGIINSKITVAAADLIDPNKEVDVILKGNITYVNSDGSDGLALIGERNVLISPDSPNDMDLKGIFVAQKGHFGRNHYPDNFRNSLDIVGSVISNGRVGTQWTSGSYIVSGYSERNNFIDIKLIYSPPPFVPYVSYDFKIVKWEEIE